MKKLKTYKTVLFFSLYLVSLSTFGETGNIKSLTLGKSSQTRQIKSVVILGNSIVAHPAAPDLGWNADWGMAASTRDSDFVHLIMSGIHQVDNTVTFHFQNISTFESGYDTYNLTQLSAFQNPDMLIIKISENVNQQTAASRNFALYYSHLIKYLAPTDNTVKVIVDGFWPSTVNDIVRNYALTNNYPFVTLPDLFSSDVSNTAAGLFSDPGVANHPSDKGMRNIATRILARISPYFAGNTWVIPSGWDGVTTSDWTVTPGVNDGTSEDKPFLIETPEHLARLAELVNSGSSYAGKFFKLIADIDLTNKNWTCIGSINPFSGNFDGIGHIIKNLSITKWTNNIGLFGLINCATIKNLGIESGTITCGGSNAGAIVGESSGTATNLSVISNCYNKANIVKGATDPRVYIGGIGGLLLNNSRIDHCYNLGNISNDGNANSSQSGGIVGAVATNSTVFSSYSAGIVTGNNLKGGVVGSNWSATTYAYYDSDVCVGTNSATQAMGNTTNTANVKGMTTDEMKSNAFVTALNDGLNTWVASSGNYPKLFWEKLSTGFNTITNSNIHIYSNNKSILINGASTKEPFIVMNLMGQTQKKGVIDSASVKLDLLNTGIYIVRVGDYGTKVIVK